jgi:general stress protein 26
MPAQLTTDQVWELIEKELFGVIGMATAEGQARTVGVVYFVDQRKLYIGTHTDTWKARHIGANPHVSVTIPLAKRIPLVPWIKIPAATITFCGTARLIDSAEASTRLLRGVYRHMADDPEFLAGTCLIEVTPEKDFITYGVGIRLFEMRDPYKARGRTAVA